MKFGGDENEKIVSGKLTEYFTASNRISQILIANDPTVPRKPRGSARDSGANDADAADDDDRSMRRFVFSILFCFIGEQAFINIPFFIYTELFCFDCVVDGVDVNGGGGGG